MATTVIIPARNEEKTIGKIVQTFNQHAVTTGYVYVVIDADTWDETAENVWANGGIAVHTNQRGKGQVVYSGIQFLRNAGDKISRIILCDADYTGLTTDHIDRILRPPAGMVIGIPDFPETDVPEHVVTSWPRISGFRCLPWAMIPENAHGYLLETQLNLRAIKLGTPVHMHHMNGLKSPFQWPLTDQRMQELQRDREWGQRHGIL